MLLVSVFAHLLLVSLLLLLGARPRAGDPPETTVAFIAAPPAVAPALPASEPAEVGEAPIPGPPAAAGLTVAPAPAELVTAEQPATMPVLATPAPAAAVAAELATAPSPDEVASSLASDIQAAVLPPVSPREPALKRLPARTAHRPATRVPTVAGPTQLASPGALSGAVPSPVNAAAPPAQVAAADPSWRSAVAAWLATHKHYPEVARENGEEGAVGVRFTVLRNGRVNDVEIPHPSGVPALDRSVREMLQGQSLPSFPPTMAGMQTDVSVTIRFALER